MWRRRSPRRGSPCTTAHRIIPSTGWAEYACCRFPYGHAVVWPSSARFRFGQLPSGACSMAGSCGEAGLADLPPRQHLGWSQRRDSSAGRGVQPLRTGQHRRRPGPACPSLLAPRGSCSRWPRRCPRHLGRHPRHGGIADSHTSLLPGRMSFLASGRWQGCKERPASYHVFPA
jgi:hypothetical protein